jgi:signal transduction histidine kinase
MIQSQATTATDYVSRMRPNLQPRLDQPAPQELSFEELQRIHLFFTGLIECFTSEKSEEEFLQQAVLFLEQHLPCEGVYLAVANPTDSTSYRVTGKSRMKPELHEHLRSSLQRLLVSGIDSVSPQIVNSLAAGEGSILVRSPVGEPERILIILAGSKEALSESILEMAEPLLRNHLRSLRAEMARTHLNELLQGIGESSRKMVRNLLSQEHLYSGLLEDARTLVKATACAILLPTDETRSSYYIKIQAGFGDETHPIPDALFTKAFMDYEINDRTAIRYAAGTNDVFLLVPLSQRNFITGILLFRGTDFSFIQAGFHGQRVAELFGDWVSTANETATLFERFAASQLEWENTFDSIADPIYIIGDDFRLKKINKSLAAYAMKSIKVPLHAQCYRYLFNQHTVCPWCPVSKSTQSGLPETVELPLFSSGTWQIQSYPFTGKNGMRLGSINILRDISLLKRMQEQLIETEKLASAGKLISGVAHEVRNPLFGISATARALANELKDKQDIQPYLDIIMSETARLNRLMEDLLNYTRPVKIDKNPSDLKELVTEVLQQLQRMPDATRAQFDVIVGDKIPPMNMDRNKMKQVLLNLFENGIQHAKKEPKLEVFLQYLSLADPPEVQLVVKDNGTGITPQNLTKVFDPFFTTRQKGTGLGLSIVRKVIHDHGGRISVESHPGIGTTFRITLPMLTIAP